MNPSPTYTVIYGSHNLNTEWALGTYRHLSAAMAHFDRLTAIRQPGEYVVLHTDHPAQ
jgi:hypothetical protein